jgi:NitT/TauT family transport system substrate-binding protein
MAAYNKLDMSKISFVQVDPAAKVVSVLEKRVDGLLGGADDQFFLIKYKGEQPAALRYADHGANIVGMTIVTQEATIKSKADLVRRFVKATVRSWDETKKNPEAAVDATLKAQPKSGQRATMLVGLKLTTALYHTDETKSLRPLRVSMKNVNESLDLLVQYGGMDPATRGKPEDWVTLEYLP